MTSFWCFEFKKLTSFVSLEKLSACVLLNSFPKKFFFGKVAGQYHEFWNISHLHIFITNVYFCKLDSLNTIAEIATIN